jgi:hypothetical protein
MFIMVPPPIQRTGPVDAPFWRHHEGRDRQSDAAEHLNGVAYHEAGHAVVAYLLVERTYRLSRPPARHCGSVDLDHAVLAPFGMAFYRCNNTPTLSMLFGEFFLPVLVVALASLSEYALAENSHS